MVKHFAGVSRVAEKNASAGKLKSGIFPVLMSEARCLAAYGSIPISGVAVAVRVAAGASVGTIPIGGVAVRVAAGARVGTKGVEVAVRVTAGARGGTKGVGVAVRVTAGARVGTAGA